MAADVEEGLREGVGTIRQGEQGGGWCVGPGRRSGSPNWESEPEGREGDRCKICRRAELTDLLIIWRWNERDRVKVRRTPG